MASTNKTSNYELSQFLGTDKPAWLSDYNTDMSKIDAQMKLNADGVTTASGSATTANTNIGTLASLTTDAKTNLVVAVNEVDSHADTAQSTANTANNTAEAASAKADQALALVNKFDLNDIDTVTVTGSNMNSGFTTLTVAKNSDASICKIYGEVRSSYQGTTTATFTSGDTGLRPESDITVQGCALREVVESNGVTTRTFYQSYTIHPNGTITWQQSSADTVANLRWFFMASIVFVKDFGDVPTPPNN